MTFKEDYHALFDQLQPSEQLLAATAAMSRRPNPKPAWRFRLPVVAASLCSICLLIAVAITGEAGSTLENQQPALRTAQQPAALSRSIEHSPETAEYNLAQEPQLAAYSEDAPAPSGAGRIACYPEAEDKMAAKAAPPLNIWLNSPSLTASLCQTALWYMYWTQSK